MKKTTLIIAAIVVLGSMVFVGCAKTEGKVSLTMYAYNERTNPVEAPNWDYVLAAFKAAYPNVDLQIEFGFSDAYHQKLQAKVVAKQVNDLVFIWPDKRTAYITGAKMMKDLRPYLKGREAEFVPGALAPQGSAGEIYEVPEQVTDCHVMYTNTKLLKQLGLTFPKTFDELLAQAPAILKAGLIPVAMDDKDGWQLQSCFLGALVGRTGGNAWFDKALKGEAKFTDPEFVNALTVIDQMAKAKMFSPGIVQASYGIAEGDFATEKAVYMIDGGWRVNALNGDLKETQYADVDLNVFPDLPADMQHGTPGSTPQTTGTGYGMRADLSGAKAEAAWNWIWFYAGPVGSAIRQGFGAVPAYKMPPRADLKLPTQKLMTFLGQTPGVYVVDSVMSPEAMGQLQPAMQEILLGRKTPQQVAADFETWVAANEPTRKGK